MTEIETDPTPPATPRPTRVLCFGEPLIDLICERKIEHLAEADAFVPHLGGAVANIALLTARAGARVAFAGAVGDDPWGGWLRGRLDAGGVDTGPLQTVRGRSTRVAFAWVDGTGDAAYAVYGRGEDSLVERLNRASLEAEIRASGGLLISSNTLVARDEREVTMALREAALGAEVPLVFDPNIRMHRWSTRADAAASANACVPGALLVRCSLAEAQLMTGEEDEERAAQSLLKAGARNVVITLGADGAMLRGRLRADVPGVPVEIVSSVGSGDAVTATLLAKLEASAWYEPVIAASLGAAVAAGAEACARWGAVD